MLSMKEELEFTDEFIQSFESATCGIDADITDDEFMRSLSEMRSDTDVTDEFLQSIKDFRSDTDITDELLQSLGETTPESLLDSDWGPSPVGIRPTAIMCQPGSVDATALAAPTVAAPTEPTGLADTPDISQSQPSWAPGAWQDATRTSAFQPYKPATLLTNLQRGNTRTEVKEPYDPQSISFYTLAGQGELTADTIDKEKVDEPDENGLTALMWAATYGQLHTSKLLLEAGADKDYQGTNGQAPLHFAAAHGHHDVVKLLLSHGADPNVEEEEGNTPLIYAAQGDHPHVCHELLTKGADFMIENVHRVSAYRAATLKEAASAKAVIENFLVQRVLSSPVELFKEEGEEE